MAKAKEKWIEGETQTGFAFSIMQNALNNFELVEYFQEMDENPFVLPKIIEMLLGKEQKKALYDHVRDKDGMVPADAIEAEIADILGASTELKNS